MIRILACLFTLCFNLVPTSEAGDKNLAYDLKKLQGVWQSSPDAKKQLKIMFMHDKLGYEITDLKAKPGEGLLSFLALSSAQHMDAKGKRYFEIEAAKDYLKRVDYRFDKKEHWISADGAEYKVELVSTRASLNEDAKKLVGTWRIVGIEQQGKPGKIESLGLDAIVFTEDRYQLIGPGDKELLNSFYRIDAGKKPAFMDWFGMKPSFVIPLVFELRENEIRFAHPPLNLIGKGAQRPTSFDTKNNDVIVIRAERKK